VDVLVVGETYGVGPDGASLVRPDGFIAWRDPGPADAPGLGKALAALYRGEGS
jgi:putative polyketide hydroxylase